MPVNMRDEFTEKMHSELTIPKDVEIKHKVGSAIQVAQILKINDRKSFEKVLSDYGVTFDDYIRNKEEWAKIGLGIQLQDDTQQTTSCKTDNEYNDKTDVSSSAIEATKSDIIHKKKKRVLYKECKIAGITFHNLKDIWDELYKGDKLALIRHKYNKHDKYAVAVALADDYDGNPDDFDFDNILGYVPRTDNEHLAKMMDLGWENAFECELSQVNGSNPYKGCLYMNIYMVSKEELEEAETSNLIRLLEVGKDNFSVFTKEIEEQGYTYFRWGGFPPWENNLPKKGEKVILLYRMKKHSVLYVMHCIADCDNDASYFTKDKNVLPTQDDCSYYVFTNSKGPIFVKNDKLSFLAEEKVNKQQAEEFLSEAASKKIKDIIKIK